MFEHLVLTIFRFFYRLGGFGLLGLGILDSSFLFMPLGNDLLVTAFTVRNPHLWPYYAAMATAGSVLGVLLMDATSRKLGEKGLENRVSKRRLDYIRKKIETQAALTLTIASLMPPPFPFTVFVIVPAALQYSRVKLLSFVAAGRMIRFSVIGLLAMFYGSFIMRMARQPAVRWTMVALALISIVGSAWSVFKLFRRSRRAGGGADFDSSRRVAHPKVLPPPPKRPGSPETRSGLTGDPVQSGSYERTRGPSGRC